MSVEPHMLRHFEVFSEFSDEELREVALFCRRETFGPGEKVIEEGKPARALYLIEKGKVSLERKVQLGRSGSSRQATVSILGPGRALGWSALVPPQIFTASGVCIEPTQTIGLDSDDLQAYTDLHPRAGLKLMNAIAVIIQGRMEATTHTLTYFLSIIAHELKSPLAAVENYMEVMLGGFAGEFTSQQQRMLERSALRLKDLRGLINDILDLARMQPEDIQADFDWLNPMDICEDALESVRLTAQENGVKLKIALQPEFQPIVGARRRLRQVLSNLLSNAVKFSPEGSVVTLRVWDEPDQLVAEVSDQGMGIRDEDHKHIFEDFFRAEDAQTIGGSGLGLSIAKKIVTAHNGQIFFKSPYEEGKQGTKFTIIIPRNLATPRMKREAWKREEA